MSEITATIVADSIGDYRDTPRLTTFVLRYPRFIHSEVMTHRVFSRNAASSRAIPVKKILEQVRSDPAMPVYWGANQAGMQAAAELQDVPKDKAREAWIRGASAAIQTAEELVALGLHKQIANRVLEPWMWMVSVVTATDWDNFYAQRTHRDAQPEFKALADKMLLAHNAAVPQQRRHGSGAVQWHLPFLTPEEQRELDDLFVAVQSGVATSQDDSRYERRLGDLQRASVARCARVSYLNHDGTSPDLKKDIELFDRLLTSGHMSPFEHQACPTAGQHRNLDGWLQLRAMVPGDTKKDFPGLKKW